MFQLFGKQGTSTEMQDALNALKSSSAARLIDVRTPQEYAAGHIPGALSLPLDELARAESLLPDKQARIYVYCLSGGRSSMAVSIFKRGGYTDVHNLGGITAYHGALEK